MKLIKSFKQGSPDWHAWRGKGIGASDAPTVVGDSPWSTPFQLWLEKTGRAQREEPNVYSLAAIQHGIKTEPEAREWYKKVTGLPMEEDVAGESEEHPFLRVSFDGANLALNRGLEIKCPGKISHDKVKRSGTIPKNYYAQVQQQLMISGFEVIDFVSYRDGEGIICPVYPDKVYQQSVLLPALVEFWHCIEFDTPPTLVDKDCQKALSMLKNTVDSLGVCVTIVEMLLRQTKKTKETR